MLGMLVVYIRSFWVYIRYDGFFIGGVLGGEGIVVIVIVE